MNENPLISVIVAVYNAEEWLHRCIDSIINQTYTNLEIILVDDGSVDDSSHICDEYADKDDRIKVIHKANGGVSDAINTGLSMVNGEYIGFVDDDDYIVPEMYEELLNAITENKVDMVLCDCTYVDEQGVAIADEISPIKKTEIIKPCEYLRRLAEPKSGYYVTIWNRLYKKDVLSNIMFPKGRTNEDGYVVHSIIKNCNNILVIKKSYCFYTQRAASISRNPSPNQYFDIIEALIGRIRFYKEEGYEQLIPSSMQELYELFMQIRRHYIFRGHKTVKGLRRASKIKREVVAIAKNNKEVIEKGCVRRLVFSDFVIAAQIAQERILGNIQ